VQSGGAVPVGRDRRGEVAPCPWRCGAVSRRRFSPVSMKSYFTKKNDMTLLFIN